MATNNWYVSTRRDIFIDFEVLATLSLERLVRFEQTKLLSKPLYKIKLFNSDIFSVKL